MAQLTIKVSAKALAMIATLQKEIFNRRRKKVTPEGVVETLVESGAKSQSDKRYAASWKNLIKDIEKAAKQTELHGNKPTNVSAEEWALILSHRNRKRSEIKKPSSEKGSSKKSAAKKKTSQKTTTKKAAVKQATPKKAVAKKRTPKKAVANKDVPTVNKETPKPRRARRARRVPSAAVTSSK